VDTVSFGIVFVGNARNVTFWYAPQRENVPATYKRETVASIPCLGRRPVAEYRVKIIFPLDISISDFVSQTPIVVRVFKKAPDSFDI
jgi:hypothetical protein